MSDNLIGYAVGRHITTTLYYGESKDEGKAIFNSLYEKYKSKTPVPLGETGLSLLLEDVNLIVVPHITDPDHTYVVQVKGEVR
jgi:hypothetical protein